MFDFLLLVGELVDKGYNGDSAEMALLSHDEKIDKVLFLRNIASISHSSFVVVN